jgi:hypothetical protein
VTVVLVWNLSEVDNRRRNATISPKELIGVMNQSSIEQYRGQTPWNLLVHAGVMQTIVYNLVVLNSTGFALSILSTHFLAAGRGGLSWIVVFDTDHSSMTVAVLSNAPQIVVVQQEKS